MAASSDHGGDDGRPSGPGLAGLSLPYRVAGAVALAAVVLLGAVHLAIVFLYVAPENTLTQKHGTAVADWVNPEFEQNWKLFAPDPLQQNIDVQVRIATRDPDGRQQVSGWIDLSAQDAAAIHGNLLPSHTQQNEVRRAWDFFTETHNAKNQPVGSRGLLSEEYLRRIVLLRVGPAEDPSVTRIQMRSATTAVPAPPWSTAKSDTRTYYRTCPWWAALPGDLPAGVRSSASYAISRSEATR